MIDKAEYNQKLSQIISRQGRLLFTRQESDTHKAYIRNAAKFNNDDEEFSNLLRSVFSHHDVNNFASIDFDDVDIAVQDNVSRYFHHQKSYYYKPEIIQGQLSSNPKLDYKEFLDRVLDVRPTRSKNRVSFLIGGVGIGKTTFLCNFLCRSYAALKEKNVLPIKINLDVTTNHKVPTTKTIIELIKTSVMNALQMSGYLTDAEHLQLAMDCAIVEDSVVVEYPDEATAESNLAHTINLIKRKHNISVFIVLDNIDYLYHLGDRGFFAEHGDQHPDRMEVREAHSAIINIVKLFWINADRATANLGMSILIPCRNDTITFLEAGHHEVPLDELEDSLFTLQEPTLAVARSVIQKRFELLDELAEKISESAKKTEFKTQAVRLQDSYERRGRLGEVLLTDLWKLSRKGLRDMIDQIRQFSYLEYFDSKRVNLNSRFTQQYYPSMLAYMLKGKRRYSQFSGNVPNIYLLNAPAPSNEMGVPVEFKEPHLYTLWLKRLILEFLLSRKSVTTTPEEVIQVFSGANKRGYPENLVRYVLSSLFAVPTAELIEVNVGADGAGGSGSYIKNINITERGEFLIRDCANSFKYLQLVVDDWKLLLPINAAGLFSFQEPDYGYLVYAVEEYGRSLDQILGQKGRQAFVFSILLEECLKYEKRVWPHVFKRLVDYKVKFDDLPSATVRSEILSIRDALKLGLDLSFLEEEGERRLRALVRSWLEEVFQPCQEFRQHFYGV